MIIFYLVFLFITCTTSYLIGRRYNHSIIEGQHKLNGKLYQQNIELAKRCQENETEIKVLKMKKRFNEIE